MRLPPLTSLLILLLLLPQRPAAALEGDLWSKPLAFLEAAMAAACSLEDREAAALGQALGTTSLVKQEVFKPYGQELGWRRRYRLAEGDELVLTREAPTGLLQRFRIEAYQKVDTGRLDPLAMVLAGSDCRIFHGRLVRRDSEGEILELEILGAGLAPLGVREPLNPPVPPGSDPGGVAIALFDSGLNYSLPSFAERLARDETGKILGYDFWDLDRRPFDNHALASPFVPLRHGTAVASVLLREAPAARLMPFRYPRPDMSRMKPMVEAAAAAGAQIVAMPMGSNKASDWSAFAAAAEAHPEMLFIVSAGNNGRDIDRIPVYPAALPLENLLVVGSADAMGHPAPKANWGHKHVDLLVPAEGLAVTGFDGLPGTGSGSSFAVPRIAALAARLLAAQAASAPAVAQPPDQKANPAAATPTWSAAELKAAILTRAKPIPGPGRSPVRHGWIPDPTTE